MALYYVMLLTTMCALIGVFEASPMSRALFHNEENPGDKRGGIPSRFRGNSFRQSIHPALERRAPPTIFRSADSEEGEDEMSGPRDHDVSKKDFMDAIFGTGWNASPNHGNQMDRIYNQDANQDYSDYDNSLDYWNYDDYRDNYDELLKDDYYYYEYGSDYSSMERSLFSGSSSEESDSSESSSSSSSSSSESEESSSEEHSLLNNLRGGDKPNDVSVDVSNKTEQNGTENEVKEPPTRRRLISRDYLFSVLGMGAAHGSPGHHGMNHNHYNNHYYYDDYPSNNKPYEYYEYYDQYPEEYYSEEVSSESDEGGSRQEETLASRKAKQMAVKRKTPTLTKKGVENELEALKEQKRRTPTAENNRFLQALKRYMSNVRFDDVRRK